MAIKIELAWKEVGVLPAMFASLPGKRALLRDLLPKEIACAELRESEAGDEGLPEELAQLGQAIEARRREFARGRTCARRALSQLGAPAPPILRGPDREPLWPSGILGSITHCQGYCAAAVARQSDIWAVGIDAEVDDALSADVVERVCTANEIAWLTTAPPLIHWDRVFFSAKESVFKAWFPLAKRWLGFEDAELTIHPAQGTFQAQLLVEGPLIDGEPLNGLYGRFLIHDGLILTSTVVPRTVQTSGRF
jgi:4'-phosphopantetheinyl transferase EntD